MAFMRRAVQLEKVIVGRRDGIGKTTFMKALMQEIPTHRRILTIEDVPELFLPSHPNKVHMFYPSEASEDDPVTAARLLKSCLRMKPNRIMLAELLRTRSLRLHQRRCFWPWRKHHECACGLPELGIRAAGTDDPAEPPKGGQSPSK